ncbi:transposable element Tcb2 transposase [Trichonephila clavipes]|nr:transposable element Tcb2 transposase [Trichonephila clavipes]
MEEENHKCKFSDFQTVVRCLSETDSEAWRVVGRLEGGETQAEVAQAIGVSQSVISRIWNRFCSLEVQAEDQDKVVDGQQRPMKHESKLHVWDSLGRRVAGRQPPPPTLQELERALLEEWDRIPQLVINSLIDSMPQRCSTLLADTGNHNPY